MTKIVFNTCYGGFSLSDKAIKLGIALSGDPKWGGDYEGREVKRTDPVLVAVVEQLGDAANGPHADLEVGEIPSGSLYRIDEYDGREVVMTPADYEWEKAP